MSEFKQWDEVTFVVFGEDIYDKYVLKGYFLRMISLLTCEMLTVGSKYHHNNAFRLTGGVISAFRYSLFRGWK